MQPLIAPIDHEARHNSYRSETNEETRRTSEVTPLLRRFQAVEQAQRSPVTTLIVTLLLVILISGVIIGIYLLILQSRAENILPPVNKPLQMVSRAQWDPKAKSNQASSTRKATEVIVVQTNTEQCHSTDTCSKLLNSIKKRIGIPYNFLISSDGQTYEALGWRRQSPLFPQHSKTSLVLAFIGNFTQIPPTNAQLLEANSFLSASISRQYLTSSYRIFGKVTKFSPKYLFASLESLPQWRKDLSDTTEYL